MYSTEGIILKKSDSGEADVLFTFYTKEYGKIRAIAQGVKKEGAKLKGHLEPLNLASVSFVLGKNGERLTGANLINSWPDIRRDYAKLTAAWQVVGLVDEQDNYRGLTSIILNNKLWLMHIAKITLWR